MLGQSYTVTIDSEAHSAADTLLEIAAPADAVVVIDEIWIEQSSIDTSENLSMKLEDVTTTGTGDAATPVSVEEGAPAAGSTVKTNHSVAPTYSGTVHLNRGFNLLDGLHIVALSPEHPICVISPSQIKAFALTVAPDGSTNFTYGIRFREIGG